MGQPSFSAIQIQGRSTNAQVIDNWVENGGGLGEIRIRPFSDNPVVVDNVIASAPSVGITAASEGGTYRDNQILAVAVPARPRASM